MWIALVKRLLVPLLGIALLAACGSGHGDTSSGVAHSDVTKAPLDLSGKWKQTNSHSKDAWQAATITGNVIEINWISDGGDTRSLYWVGTYTAPAASSSHFTWVSTRDRAKTDVALLASSSATKKFTYSGGELRWEASMMGTTMIIRAKRD